LVLKLAHAQTVCTRRSLLKRLGTRLLALVASQNRKLLTYPSLCIYRFQGMLTLQTPTGNAQAGFLALYGEMLMAYCVLFLTLLQAYISNIVPHSLLMLSFTILKLTLITLASLQETRTSSQPLLCVSIFCCWIGAASGKSLIQCMTTV